MVYRFLKEFFQSFYAPRSLYMRISQRKNSSSRLCVLIYSVIYALGSLWLYLHGYTPFVEPWIRVSEDIYYLIQAFYIIPLVFLICILGTGVIHLLCSNLGGKGRFEVLFSMTSYSLWVPWYLLMIIDCIHATPEWIYNTILFTSIVFILVGT